MFHLIILFPDAEAVHKFTHLNVLQFIRDIYIKSNMLIILYVSGSVWLCCCTVIDDSPG